MNPWACLQSTPNGGIPGCHVAACVFTWGDTQFVKKEVRLKLRLIKYSQVDAAF
jgi:hypothetical protein